MGVQIDWLDTDNLIVAACPVTMLDIIWPMVEDILARPIAKSHGEVTIDSIKGKLKNADALLLTISRGTDIIAAVTVEVRTFESGVKALYIPLVGGNEMDKWMHRVLEIAKAIGKDFGCTELRGIAVRKGWLRKLNNLGWEEVSTTIKCDIGD